MKKSILLFVMLFYIAFEGLSQTTTMYYVNQETGMVQYSVDVSRFDHPYVLVEIPDSVIHQSYNSQKPLSWGNSTKSNFKMIGFNKVEFKETFENTLIGDPDSGMRLIKNYSAPGYESTPIVILLLLALVFLIVFHLLFLLESHKIGIKILMIILSIVCVTIPLDNLDIPYLNGVFTIIIISLVVLMFTFVEYEKIKFLFWRISIIIYIMFAVVFNLLFNII